MTKYKCLLERTKNAMSGRHVGHPINRLGDVQGLKVLTFL